jgi:hypothetical protein
MGYYKDRFTHWGTVGDGNEDLRLNKRDRQADDRLRGKLSRPSFRRRYCTVMMIDTNGFNWGNAGVWSVAEYEQYKVQHPTWHFFNFQE